MGVLSTLTSRTRDSSPVRTSFFVILKNKIYLTLFLQLLFSPSPLYQNLFFVKPQAVIYLFEECGPSLIVSGIAAGRLRAGDCFLYSFL